MLSVIQEDYATYFTSISHWFKRFYSIINQNYLEPETDHRHGHKGANCQEPESVFSLCYAVKMFDSTSVKCSCCYGWHVTPES